MKKIKMLLLVSLILSCAKQNDQQKILDSVINHISSENVPFRRMHYHNDNISVDNQGKMILIHPKMNESHFKSVWSKIEKFTKNDDYSIDKQLALHHTKNTLNGIEVRSYTIPNNKRIDDILHKQQAHAVMSFAPFIYNKADSEIILFVNYACGSLCGGIYQYTLIRDSSEWEISDVKPLSVY